MPLISDTIPANGSVITTSWPVISATLSDPEPCSGIQPLSTALILDSERDSSWVVRPPTWL